MRCFPVHVWLLMLFCMVLAGCGQDDPNAPYFTVDGRLVEFNLRVGTARFLVNVKQLRDVAPGHVAVGRFEDPAGGEPILVREPVLPNTRRTPLATPPLRCIVKDRPYKVSIRIEDGGGKVLQTLETTLVSDQNQASMPDQALVVGPLYTPNPEMGTRPASDAMTDCPS